jgi:hypothetical protein
MIVEIIRRAFLRIFALALASLPFFVRIPRLLAFRVRDRRDTRSIDYAFPFSRVNEIDGILLSRGLPHRVRRKRNVPIASRDKADSSICLASRIAHSLLRHFANGSTLPLGVPRRRGVTLEREMPFAAGTGLLPFVNVR